MTGSAQAPLTSIPASEQHIRLADGRRLAFLRVRRRRRRAGVLLPWLAKSRLDFAANHRAAVDAGVRVIAVDRPGIGGSDPQPGRRVLDWPDHVAALADALGVSRFAVLGFSFGGPYARAYSLPDTITRAGLVSCLGAIDDPAGRRDMPAPTRYGLAAARVSPLLAWPMVWFTARQALSGNMIDQLSKSMSPPDAEVLKRRDVAEASARASPNPFAMAPPRRPGTA